MGLIWAGRDVPDHSTRPHSRRDSLSTFLLRPPPPLPRLQAVNFPQHTAKNSAVYGCIAAYCSDNVPVRSALRHNLILNGAVVVTATGSGLDPRP
eukprot:1732249-Rhodomonas_salina.1